MDLPKLVLLVTSLRLVENCTLFAGTPGAKASTCCLDQDSPEISVPNRTGLVCNALLRPYLMLPQCNENFVVSKTEHRDWRLASHTNFFFHRDSILSFASHSVCSMACGNSSSNLATSRVVTCQYEQWAFKMGPQTPKWIIERSVRCVMKLTYTNV